MGGSAFSQDKLSTPRMPPRVYEDMLARVEAQMRGHFRLVGHPLEAPEKTSYGDIDVVVAEPLGEGVEVTGEFLAQVTGAHTWKSTRGSGIFNLAVEWPGAGAGDASSDTTKNYIQVDINNCLTPAAFAWLLFREAHGDLWNMLGGVLHRHGLTCTPTGLYLRIAEVEAHNRERARVLMTDDTDVVLDYLGLDRERYAKPFATLEDLMAYVASCRFHDPGWGKRKNLQASGAGVEDKACRELKPKDKHRSANRPAFGYWLNTYLPAHQDDEPGKDAHLARQEVVQDAQSYFGPEFAASFEQRKTTWVRQIGLEQLWPRVKKSLPTEGAETTFAVKGLKREIAGDRDHVPVDDVDESVRAAYVEGRFEDVFQWAMEHWEQAGERQKLIDQEKTRLHFREYKKKQMATESGTD